MKAGNDASYQSMVHFGFWVPYFAVYSIFVLFSFDGDGEGDGVEVTDDERDTVLPDPLVECFTRSGRRVKRPKRD